MIITNIKRESSTFISIADPDRTNPSERVVSITGTPAGIAKAIQLIRNVNISLSSPLLSISFSSAHPFYDWCH
jgi:hypothetical protein